MIYLINGRVECFRRTILAWVDHEIIEYYRSLIPKCKYVKPPKAKAHVSIVRPFEWPDRPFSQFNGDRITIRYYLPIRSDSKYYWLDCQSEEILKIRRKLGLADYLKNECYHISVGNVKNS